MDTHLRTLRRRSTADTRSTPRNQQYTIGLESSKVSAVIRKRERNTKKEHGLPLIEKNTFFHSDLRYDFKYHVGKLEDELDYNRDIVRFIKDVPNICPNELFNNDSRDTKRASSLDLDIRDDPSLYKTNNHACRLAELSLKANNNRKKRHTEVEDFMLSCDTATVATELPIWYYDKKLETSITGHIDLVQLRGGKIYILDYKTEAEKKNPLSQLYVYCRAFSYRTKTSLEKIRAAWFDENTYIQFSPSKIA